MLSNCRPPSRQVSTRLLKAKQQQLALVRVEQVAPAVWQALLDRGVLVRDVSSGPGLTGWLRVNAGTEAETTTFLTALQAVAPERTP